MKDYACERIYRDARITSIYEGTTQLQVVAAIRHVTTGTYLKMMRDYETAATAPELAGLRETLKGLADTYEATVAEVNEHKNSDYIDFQARRLVEMAGYIIMSHLLINDATRDKMFRVSAEIFVQFTEGEIAKHAGIIAGSKPDDLTKYTKCLLSKV